MKKNRTPEQSLESLRDDLTREHAIWENHRLYGCNDPFWADGVNMNLVRNHIISYRREILEVCEEYGLPLPSEYFLPVPPEVPNGYMANLDQGERVSRIMESGEYITTKQPPAEASQMSFV